MSRSSRAKTPGEFQIKQGFLDEELSVHFSVGDPVMVDNHIEYEV
jgi:hypothetical protein